MTKVTYEDGILMIEQRETFINFRPRDLDFESRSELMRAVADIAGTQLAGVVGFLKTQPVEVRQAALEEALGVSFPCGTGE